MKNKNFPQNYTVEVCNIHTSFLASENAFFGHLSFNRHARLLQCDDFWSDILIEQKIFAHIITTPLS